MSTKSIAMYTQLTECWEILNTPENESLRNMWRVTKIVVMSFMKFHLADTPSSVRTMTGAD
jgi:hypothetical protein